MQPPARKWAPRHNGQSLSRRASNGGTDEHRADPASLQLRGHARVDKDQPPGLRQVNELGRVIFQLNHEPTLIGYVDDGGFGRFLVHDWTFLVQCGSGVGRSGGKIELEVNLIDVAPEPLLTWLKRANQRMACRPEMGGCMATRRVVAATHVPAGLTHPEVYPMATSRKALHTARATRPGSGDGVHMCAKFHALTLFAGPCNSQ